MFPKYPYLDLSDRNLDFLTKAIREMENEVKNFVSLNAVKYANPIQWSINRQYEKNTIVIDPLTGTAFISVQPVPNGVSLTRTQYWTPVFDLSQFVTKAASNFANSYERDITTTATMATGAGDWVVWNSTLYVALTSIHEGDAYVVNGNIKRMTVEDFYDLLMQAIHSLDEELDTEIRNRTDADATLQDNIDAEVRARGETDDALSDRINDIVNDIGSLSDLTTTNKTKIVNAINELVGDVDSLDDRINNLTEYDKADIRNYGGVGDGVTDDTTAFNDCLLDNNLVYLPSGYNFKLSEVTLSAEQSVIGSEGVTVTYSGNTSLFTITGSHVQISDLTIQFTNYGTAFEILNTSANWLEYIYISNITTYKAGAVITDINSSNSYTNTYLTRVSGRQMNGTAYTFHHAFAFLFLNDVTADNIGSNSIVTWNSFYFKNCEGAHLTHCEAEGGGVDGSHPAANGFYFDNCAAIWLERCMSDLVEGSGFWFNNCRYCYLSNCITSISFGNGFVFGTNCNIITCVNCVSGGRAILSPNISGANGFYSFANNLTMSNCQSIDMTGYGLSISAGGKINVGNVNLNNNGYGIFLSGDVDGLIHDVVMVNNNVNTIQDALTGTLKYYQIWNGSTFETNII